MQDLSQGKREDQKKGEDRLIAKLECIYLWVSFFSCSTQTDL